MGVEKEEGEGEGEGEDDHWEEGMVGGVWRGWAESGCRLRSEDVEVSGV